jgi:hypothetical protein
MNFEAARAELLAQHGRLRLRIDEVRAAVGLTRGFEATIAGDLRAQVSDLAEALNAHNRREEELLRGVLCKVDAWGSVREELMGKEHRDEHDELAAALLHPEALSQGGKAMIAVLDRIVDHMAHEERTFLDEALVCGEAAVAEQFSG